MSVHASQSDSSAGGVVAEIAGHRFYGSGAHGSLIHSLHAASRKASGGRWLAVVEDTNERVIAACDDFRSADEALSAAKAAVEAIEGDAL